MGGVSRGYAQFVVRFRWLVLLGVGAGAWAALTLLPGFATAGGGLSGVVTSGAPAIAAQAEAVRRFGVPLLARTAVVQRNPAGLDPGALARAVRRALRVDEATLTGTDRSGLLGALPLPNSPLLVPAANERNTTVVTYLFADPALGPGAQDRLARAYAADIDQPGDSLVGVTGTVPVLVAQGNYVGAALPWVELAALASVAVIVGVNFRSVLAPVLTLITAAVAYLVADHVIGYVAVLLGISAPAELEPVIVALLLGVVTDYTIFFLSGMRQQLACGEQHPRAALLAIADYLPIVVTAGITVAAGVAGLVVAHSGLFHAFGPGLAVTVLVGLGVSVTLVPALLAVLGRWAFWPGGLPQRPAGSASIRPGSRLVRWVVARLGDRRIAALAAVVVLAALGAAAVPLLGERNAVSPAAALPAGDPVRQAAAAASAGFAPGIRSPTEVLVGAQGIAAQPQGIAALATELNREPGVVSVLGPGDQPLPLQLGLFVAPDGGAARFLVVFDADPLGATAIANLRGLQRAMPGLLGAAGLPGAHVDYAGDTALGLSLVDQARADLGRVALAVGLVDLLLLALFLRALVAPLYLFACSVLAVGASLGLTTWLFQDVLGADGLIFYVPFAAGVLLVSLGSDYNIFSVGYIWEQARRRPLTEALAAAVPQSTRAISAAGVTLAASFAFVALVPVAPFRQLAFAMAAGVLIDAFLVRSLLVPALISLVGRASGWPGNRLRRDTGEGAGAPQGR